jgi:hypothetical protein
MSFAGRDLSILKDKYNTLISELVTLKKLSV